MNKKYGLKRILTLFVAIVTVFATVASFTAAGVSAEEAELDIKSDAPGIWEIFKEVGIAETDQAFEMTSNITRGEFAIYAARTIGVNEYSGVDENFYLDLNEDDPSYYAVNYLAKMGVVSVPEDRLFNPDNVISTDEAVKIMVSLIGGGDLAERSGGYPAGYRRIAKERDILDGIQIKDQLTCYDMCMLIYNAINAEMYNVEAIVKDGSDYYAIKGIDGGTLLSVYYDIYSLEGVVDGVEEVTLNSSQSLTKGQLSIDGQVYKMAEENSATTLGIYAKVFFKYNKNTKERSIVWIGEADDENVGLVIEAKDFTGASASGVSYYSGEKKMTANIEAKTSVIYNGQVISENIGSAIKLSQGSMTLFDTDDNGKFDLVVIWDYVNTVVSSVDVDGEKVFDKYSADKNIDISTLEEDAVRVFNPDGSKAEFSNIVAGTVVTSYVSDTSAYIYINNRTLNGTVESIWDDGIVINGEKYEGDAYMKENIKTYAVSGQKYAFLLDKFGMIAEVSGVDILNTMKIAYVIGYSKGDGFVRNSQIKLYTKEGEMKIFDLAEKVTVDGQKRNNPDEVESALKLGQGESVIEHLRTVSGQAICYKTDDDGKINNIDTSYLNGNYEDPKNTLCEMAGYAERSWYSYQTMLGNDILMDGTTICFGTPLDEDLLTAEKKEFTVTNANYFRTMKGPYNNAYRCESYAIGNDKGFSDIVIFKGPFGAQTALTTDYQNEYDIYLVDEIITALDSDGEVVQAATLYFRNNKSTYYSNTATFFDDNGIKSGDLITLRKDYYGKVSHVAKYYNYDPADLMPDTWKTKGSLGWNSFLSRGYVIDINENIIKLGYDNCTDANEYIKTNNTTAVLYYDANPVGRKSHVEVSNVSSLMPYSKSDMASCSKIFAIRKHTNPSYIVVYR